MSKLYDSSSNNNYILIPKNLKHFLYQYKYSKFIECNKELATKNAYLFPNYTQNMTKNAKFLIGMKYLKEKFEEMYLPYWLMAGTLLGL